MHRCIQDFENLMDDLFTGNEYTPPNEFNSKMEDVKLNILRQVNIVQRYIKYVNISYFSIWFAV